MHGQRQGIRSTKQKEPPQEETAPKPSKKEHDIYVKVVDLQETIYTDQTGKFPYLSSKGNRYIMVAVHIDANYIAMQPMKNRTEGQIIDKSLEGGRAQHAQAHPGQRGIRGIQGSDQTARDGLRTGPPKQPQTQHRRTSRPNNEEPLHCSPLWDGRQLPNAPLVQAPTPSRKTVEHAAPLQHHTQGQRVCPCPWTTQLREASLGATRLRDAHARAIIETQELGQARHHVLELGNKSRALSLLHRIRQENESRKGQRHGLLQTQEPNPTHPDQRGCSGGRSPASQFNHQRLAAQEQHAIRIPNQLC
ncbi:hypothetical protein ACHAWF_012589 [Thalassiosira exigua]